MAKKHPWKIWRRGGAISGMANGAGAAASWRGGDSVALAYQAAAANNGVNIEKPAAHDGLRWQAAKMAAYIASIETASAWRHGEARRKQQRGGETQQRISAWRKWRRRQSKRISENNGAASACLRRSIAQRSIDCGVISIAK
jgi:hypothetical protein